MFDGLAFYGKEDVMKNGRQSDESIDAAWARQFLAAADFDKDVRKPVADGPKPTRLGHFRRGWRDAHRDPYDAKTFRELTWQNLGHRCGERLGDGAAIDAVFQVFREVYAVDGPVQRDGSSGRSTLRKSRV